MKKIKSFAVMIAVSAAVSQFGGISYFESKAEAAKDGSQLNLIRKKAVTDYSQYEDNEMLVIYQDGTKAKEKKQIRSQANAKSSDTVTDWCDKIVLKDGQDLEQAVETLAQDQDVLYVQPNFKYTALSTKSSAEDISGISEKEFSKQWWIYNDGTFKEPETSSTGLDDFMPDFGHLFWPWSTGGQASSRWDDLFGTTSGAKTAVTGIDTNAAKAWNTYTDGGRRTVVALIDTGVDYTHPELKDSIWINSSETQENRKDDDGNGYVDDIYGWNFYDDSSDIYVGTSRRGNFHSENEDAHGTHVAGIIAAAMNGSGTAGIASNTNVELMCLKALGDTDGNGSTESIVKAIQYAEEKGAAICNMSLGISESDIPFYYQDYDAAMKTAIKNSSMLFVAAAGNEAVNTDSNAVYPSSYDFDNIISVGFIDCDGSLDSYSNYGKTTVDLAAPGGYIYSTIPDGEYGYMTGSSMAAPMVTAACAMGYAYAQNPDVLAVRERILANVTVLDSLKGKTSTGGMLNVFDAVKDLAEHSYSYTGDFYSNQDKNTSSDNSNISNSNTNTNNEDSNNNPNMDQNNSNTEPDYNSIQNNDSTAAVGQNFISGGIIYKITSDAAVLARGIADNSSRTITIKATVTYQSKKYKVTKIAAKAFYKNQSVRKVKIGKNVKIIGKRAFISCPQLLKVTGMKGVTKICAGAFKNCKKLKSIPSTKNINVAKTAFSGCKKL